MVRVTSSSLAAALWLLCSTAFASLDRDIAPRRRLEEVCNINDAVFFEQFVYLEVQGELSQVTKSDLKELQNAFQQAYDQAVDCDVGFRQVTKVTIFTNPFGTGTPPSGTVTGVWYANVRSLCLGLYCDSELFIYDSNTTSTRRLSSSLEEPEEPRRLERRSRGDSYHNQDVNNNNKVRLLKGGKSKKDKKSKNKSAPKDFLKCGGGKSGKKSKKCPGYKTPSPYTRAPASAPVAETVTCECKPPSTSAFLAILNQLLSGLSIHITVVLGISNSNDFPESMTASPTYSPSLLATPAPVAPPTLVPTIAPSAEQSQGGGTNPPSAGSIGGNTPMPTSLMGSDAPSGSPSLAPSDTPSLAPSLVPSGGAATPVAESQTFYPEPTFSPSALTMTNTPSYITPAPTPEVQGTSTAPTAATPAPPSSPTASIAPTSSFVCPCGNGNRGTGVCFDTSLCCSPYGYCGTGSAYCGNINNSTDIPCGDGQVGNGLCEDTSLCCSQFGYCGVGSEYCGSSNSSATAAPTTSTESLPCGKGIRGTGVCEDSNLCCSPCGYCGEGTGFCS